MQLRFCARARIILCGLIVLICAAAATGQFRASIQGTVTDPQGAAVDDATITVTNKETAKAQEVKSSGGGFYRVSNLSPGTYTVTAEKSGHKKKVLENVTVSAETTQGLDITLDVGEITESVTVTEEAGTPLKTENANIEGSITTREIQRLPQSGRDPYQLVRLTPGVFGLGARNGNGDGVGFPNRNTAGGAGGNIFDTENRPEISAGGQRVESNNIQIDGVSAMSQAWGGAAVITPNQESVKEVRVLATNYSAENGRNTGAQIQVVSQTGTNDLHGSLFFKRNTPGMNSIQNFTRAGTAIRENPQKVNRFLSQYGGSVGGPIPLPRFGEGGPVYWSGKNKLFFFFSYETVRQSASQLAGFWIETPQLFNAIRNRSNIAGTIFNFVGTSRVASVDSSATCGAAGFDQGVNCNKVTGGLDIGSINLAATRGVEQPGLGGGLDGIPDIQFAQLPIPDATRNKQYNARIDYQVTKNDLVAFSMYFVPSDRTFNDTWANRDRPALDFTSARRNMVGTLLWTRTLSPTMINEARFNATRWYFDEVTSNAKIGWGLPKAFVCDAGGGCNNWGGGAIGPGVFYQNTYNFRDTLSKVVNAHGLKFGGDVIAEQNNDNAPWAGRPEFWFDNIWSFANDAPDREHAFFDPQTGAFTDLAAYARTKYYSLFFQDDWKIRPNLTLNLGLRWEYFAPLTSKRDRISNLILGPNGDLLGAKIKAGGNLFNPDRNNFGPQFGFAWSPKRFNDKAVLRGGFGIGFNRLPGSKLFESRFNVPFLLDPGDLFGTDLLYAVASDLNSFNYPANPAARRSFDPNTGLPLTGRVNIRAFPQDLSNSYAYRYSVEGEYDIGSGWVATLGYQGSKGRALPRLVPYHLFVTPNPRIGNVDLLLPDAYSNFNALLAGAQHRFSRGFLFNTEYRFAKSRDTCSSDNGCTQTYPFDQSTEYGPSDFDVRHSFKAFGVWTLPVFRGRHNWAERLAGGWELSGILQANSGFPWTPVVGGNQCGAVVAGGGCLPVATHRPDKRCTGRNQQQQLSWSRAVPGRWVDLLHAAAIGNFHSSAAARHWSQQLPGSELLQHRYVSP